MKQYLTTMDIPSNIEENLKTINKSISVPITAISSVTILNCALKNLILKQLQQSLKEVDVLDIDEELRKFYLQSSTNQFSDYLKQQGIILLKQK